MIFNGFQKMTLLDFPGKVACTLFTGGCNFRCPFCHNAVLVENPELAEEISEQFVLDFLKKRQGLLDGVCITGGEPLLQSDLEQFIIKVKEMGYAVKLDTNGSYPEKLISLCEKGLIDYVAMDVKSSMEKYPLCTGIKDYNTAKVEQSIDYLLRGRIDYEFRTTVADELHTPEDIEILAKRIEGAKRYFLQNFVDSGNILGENLSPVPHEKLVFMRSIASKYVQNCEIRGE